MPDLSRWTLRVFESRDGVAELLYYVQSPAGMAWGPFSSEVEAWARLKDGDPDGALGGQMLFPLIYYWALAQAFYDVMMWGSDR
jgi:hypothetical protein